MAIRHTRNSQPPSTLIQVVTLTQSSGTATVTTKLPHGLASGDFAVISGASPSGYNGRFQVTVTGATTFTYAVDSGLSSPASGTIETVTGKFEPTDLSVDGRSGRLRVADGFYAPNANVETTGSTNVASTGVTAFSSITLDSDTQFVIWTVLTANIYITYAGDDPTSSAGHLVAAGTTTITPAAVFALIRARAASGTAVVHTSQMISY